MDENNRSPVVVAVGHDPMESAISFAATEAARAGCGVHLVHVLHLLAQGPEVALLSEIDLERAGRLALNHALELARDQVGEGSPVTSELVVGGPVVPGIVDAAGVDATMIVLEHRDLSRAARIVTRSVASGVAAHARVPVVSVPSSWAEGTYGRAPTVTVGVDVPDRSGPVLRAAVAAARARGAVLRVVHTWNLPTGYDDIIVSPEEHTTWSDRAAGEIEAALDALAEDLSDVPVQIAAQRGYAADVLLDASRSSDLLVMGRHDPLLPMGSHLGPIVRAVLREARCPVLLVDPQRAGRRHLGRDRASGGVVA